jgi:hypothetical protein
MRKKTQSMLPKRKHMKISLLIPEESAHNRNKPRGGAAARNAGGRLPSPLGAGGAERFFAGVHSLLEESRWILLRGNRFKLTSKAIGAELSPHVRPKLGAEPENIEKIEAPRGPHWA